VKKRFLSAFLALLMVCSFAIPSSAYQSTTLRPGMENDAVREMQEALIKLGYLKGEADGKFGNATENAVRAFQRKNKLNVDGLAGSETLALLFAQASGSGSDTDGSAYGSGKTLFGGNYSTIKSGSKASRIKVLQKALIQLKYLSGKADGKYGKKTTAAVKAFQSVHSLKADGLAGKKTLKALEKAVSAGDTAVSTPTPAPEEATPTPDPTDAGIGDEDVNEKITPPAVSSIRLLSWYDDVKPNLQNKQTLLIYEPVSGLSWSLSVLARGRHCDAEPLTGKDTRTMIRAFGNQNTWTQKGVYVRLPDGTWTIGSTHDMPHLSGNILDNDFNGHLCVHFLRTMEEASQNDPNYGVSNQKTIRAFWKKLTGEEITD